MRDPIAQLLEDAAAAGRTSDPTPEHDFVRTGHKPVPPTLRCQQCGRRLELQATDGRWWWSHEADDMAEPAEGAADPPQTWGEALGMDEGPAFYAPEFDRAFDEVYRR
jgi:hypothetical protein